MTHVHLRGHLVCRTENEVATVHRHLAVHRDLTRAETGCVAFDVRPTEDPLVFEVDETFADADAFEAHQIRTAASAWGRATTGIERRYTFGG